MSVSSKLHACALPFGHSQSARTVFVLVSVILSMAVVVVSSIPHLLKGMQLRATKTKSLMKKKCRE